MKETSYLIVVTLEDVLGFPPFNFIKVKEDLTIKW